MKSFFQNITLGWAALIILLCFAPIPFVPEGGPRVAFAILGTVVGIGLYVVSHKDTK